MIRRQTICRVIYRDAKGRFVRPPEKPARVELEPLPKGEKGRFRVHKGGEVVAVEEMPRGRGVRVRFVPDASIRKAMLEARARGDKATLRQIREWEREVKRLAAEDYLKAKRSKEWAKRMERAKQKSDASKGGKRRLPTAERSRPSRNGCVGKAHLRSWPATGAWEGTTWRRGL